MKIFRNPSLDIDKLRAFINKNKFLRFLLKLFFIYSILASILFPLLQYIVFEYFIIGETIVIEKSEYYFLIFRRCLSLFLSCFILFVFLRIRCIDRLFEIKGK